MGIHFNSDEETATKLCDELSQKYGDVNGAKYVVVRGNMGSYDDVCIRIKLLHISPTYRASL